MAQKTLAFEVGVKQPAISKWLERPTPPAGKLQAIAAAAGFDPKPWEGSIANKPSDGFFWICPNVTCSHNKLEFRVHAPSLFALVDWSTQWEGGSEDDVNYCDRCGTRLVKKCLSDGCDRPITRAMQRSCMRCGASLVDPMATDWRALIVERFGSDLRHLNALFVYENDQVSDWRCEFEHVVNVQDFVDSIWRASRRQT